MTSTEERNTTTDKAITQNVENDVLLDAIVAGCWHSVADCGEEIPDSYDQGSLAQASSLRRPGQLGIWIIC